MSEHENLAKAVGIITVAMIVSRLFGYIRDAMIYAQFGQGRTADIYNAAFSIPDFLYTILVGGALSSAFIPVFGSYLAKHKDDDAWYMASSLLNIMILALLFFIGLGMIFTPQLVHLLVPGFDGGEVALTTKLTRIMFCQTFLMGLSGVTIGILNAYKHFNTPALGSILYNLAIVVVGYFFGPKIGIMAFSIGVVFGAFLNLVVQIPPLIRLGLRYKMVIDLNHPGIRRIGVLVLPIMIGLSVAQFNLFVSQNLASGLPGGQLAALRTAQRLMQIPLGIFAVAIGTAIFPTLTEEAALKQWDRFRRTTSLGVRTTNYLTIPSAVLLVALGLPAVRLFFQMGKFTAGATWATAVAVYYYSFGIIGYSGALVLTRAYYALQDTKTPVIVGIGTVFLNLILNLLLVKPLGYRGLALAYSIVGTVNMLALLVALKWKVGQIDGKKMVTAGIGSTIAALLMGSACYFTVFKLQMVLGVASKLSQLVAVGLAGLVGVVVYLMISYLLKLEELRLVMQLLGRKVGFLRRFGAV